MWFRRMFAFATGEQIEQYRWVNKQWETAVVQPPSLTETLIVQQLPEGEITIEGGQDQSYAEYHQHKAYVVWRSHGDKKNPSYDVKREIYILFWLKPEEQVDYGEARDWLDKACKNAFRQATPLDEVETWHDSSKYQVDNAYWGTADYVTDDELNKVSWYYTANGSPVVQARKEGWFWKR